MEHGPDGVRHLERIHAAGEAVPAGTVPVQRVEIRPGFLRVVSHGKRHVAAAVVHAFDLRQIQIELHPDLPGQDQRLAPERRRVESPDAAGILISVRAGDRGRENAVGGSGDRGFQGRGDRRILNGGEGRPRGAPVVLPGPSRHLVPVAPVGAVAAEHRRIVERRRVSFPVGQTGDVDGVHPAVGRKPVESRAEDDAVGNAVPLAVHAEIIVFLTDLRSVRGAAESPSLSVALSGQRNLHGGGVGSLVTGGVQRNRPGHVGPESVGQVVPRGGPGNEFVIRGRLGAHAVPHDPDVRIIAVAVRHADAHRSDARIQQPPAVSQRREVHRVAVVDLAGHCLLKDRPGSVSPAPA